MANEFKSVLRAFSTLAENYCDNAQKIVPSPDHEKLVDIYRAGLSVSCRSLERALVGQYDRASEEWRAQADDYVALTGVLQMTEAANRVIGKNSFNDPMALSESSGVFEKVKRVLADIPGVLPIPFPFPGGIGKLLGLIDNFIDLIRKLFDSKQEPVVSKVDTTYQSYTLKPCEWKTVHEGPVANLDISTYPGRGDEDQVEVREDGKLSSRLLQSYPQKFSGKKIEVHLKTGGKPEVEISTHPSH